MDKYYYQDEPSNYPGFEDESMDDPDATRAIRTLTGYYVRQTNGTYRLIYPSHPLYPNKTGE